MAQYEKLINLSLLNQFLTKAKTIFAPKITASGILKGDGNGGVSAATAGTDYVTPAQSLALGLTGASVGDLVRVNAVDGNGKPTSWKHVPLSEIKCNHNYVENWDFTNPVNQRGQQSYSTTGYCIDRWWRIFGVTTVTDGGISITGVSSESYGPAFRQALSDPKKFAGKTVTISVLVDEITGGALSIACYKASGMNSGMVSALVSKQTTSPGVLTTTGTIPDDVGSNTYPLLIVSISVSKGATAKIRAAKLELGSEQTLAHNEGTEQNPVWVLNEIPDYGEELAKCQTSRADSTDTYANQEIAIINRNAGAHNGIYRGKYLGSTVTAEQYAAINAGTFDDLYIGDYWTIGGVNYRIAALDYWLHCGDTECTTHHVVVVPDTRLYNAQMHNTESGAYIEGVANNPVTGAYVGSDIYTTNLTQAKTTISNAFGSAHILNHREYLKNAVNGAYESAGAWYDSTVELMTEQMVYGGKIFANALQAGSWAAQHTIDKSQLPLFALEPSRICIRATWWLRDVASSANFAFVDYNGNAGAYNSSYPFGVRPAFGIKA